MSRIIFFFVILVVAFSANARKYVPQRSGMSGTSGTLIVSVTTANPGGLYDPENVMAIWIQDSAGKLVNTMMYFTTNTNESAKAMSEWWSMIGSHWSDDKEVLDTYTLMDIDGICGPTLVDGISSPTKVSAPSYGSRICYWGKSVDLNLYPDGVYTVKMELVNDEVAVGEPGHQVASFNFTKGPGAFYVAPDDALPGFKSIFIEWVPNLSGLNSLELSNKYSIYPNPAKSFVFVNGADIKSVEILTLSGVILFKSKLQTLNLACLPSGTYLAQIKTGKGIIVKKIVKK